MKQRIQVKRYPSPHSAKSAVQLMVEEGSCEFSVIFGSAYIQELRSVVNIHAVQRKEQLSV